MKRTTGGVFVAGLVFSMFIYWMGAPAARAQSSTDGAIGGTVADQSGAVVPNAGVSATNLGTGSKSTSTTDESGKRTSTTTVSRLIPPIAVALFRLRRTTNVEDITTLKL